MLRFPSRPTDRLLRGGAMFACMFLAGSAAAIDRTWDGSSSQSWNTAANWTPSGVPTSADNALLALDSANVTLAASGVAQNVTLTTGAMLHTNGSPLTVNARTTLNKTTVSEVVLFIEPGAATNDLTTNFLDVTNGSELDMSGGRVLFTSTLTVDDLSEISGSGTIDVGPAAGAMLINDGAIRPDNGTLELRKPSGSGPTFDLDGLSGDGVLDVTQGASKLVINGALNDAFYGSLTIGDGNFVTMDTTTPWVMNGTLRLQGPSARLSGQDFEVHAPTARIEGNGLILASVSNDGILSPGFSVGAIAIADALTLGDTATLEIEVGGALSTQYDRVVVGSTAELGGTLDLTILPGFTPHFGDVYTILSSTFGVSECFSTILGRDIDGPLVLAHDYTDVAVLIRPALPGDANFDGAITGADYTLWADHFSDDCADFGMGDFNGDSFVTGADFTIWADHFGQVVAPAATVPEPPAALLGVAVGLTLTIVRRRGQLVRLAGLTSTPRARAGGVVRA